MKNLIAIAWRAVKGPLQWRLLWLWNAKFMIGVVAVIRNEDGHVLILKHRLWPEGRQWGLPTGYAKKSETFEETVAREVREETELKVRATRLLELKSGYRLRAEVAFEAEFLGGTLRVNPMEILEGGWFPPDALPTGLQENHRRLIEQTIPA